MENCKFCANDEKVNIREMVKYLNLKLPERSLVSDVESKGEKRVHMHVVLGKVILAHVHIGYLNIVKYCIGCLVILTL